MTRLLRQHLPKILTMVGVLLALAIPLMFLMEDFVRDVIVQPMAYQLWLFGVIIDALPQAVILIAFLPILIYLAVRSLKGSKAKIRQAEQVELASQGNLQTWLRRMRLVMQGSYSKERFDHQLGQLLLQLIAHQQRLPMRETIHQFKTGDIEIPSEIEPYIQAAMRSRFSGKRSPFQWLRDLFQKRQRTGFTTHDELEDHIAPALNYIEGHLRIQPVEVDNDN